MSIVTDSPVHSSSSSDDFAAFLESTLDSKSSDSSPDEEAVTDGHSDSSDSSSDQESKNDCNIISNSFRQFGFNCKCLSELKSDEDVSDGALSSVLKVLRRIHFLFFDELGDNVDGRDVRQVLKTVRKEVLKNCKLVFSRVFPTKFQAEKHHLWKMAEQLGAYCSTELDQTVTHVVSTDAGTEKSRWAVKEKKFLVHPRWIESANYLWQRQLEENFTLDQLKNQ